MLGDETAGKTSLTIRYISGFFLDNLKLTIGVDFYSKTTSFNERKVKLQIWDFGGEERFRFLLHQYCRGANAAFFLYDITNRTTLDKLPDWTRVIRENAGDIPIILVGTNAHQIEERVVTREEGVQAVRAYNLSAFIEVSAKTGQNVERLFETITEILFDRHRLEVITDNRRLRRHQVNLNVMKRNRRYSKFKVNKYITLRLENSKTVIYVRGKKFQQCKYLFLDIPVDET